MKTDLAFLDDEMQESPATAHLCLYMAEKRGFQEYCAHLPDDDKTLLTRLDFISPIASGAWNYEQKKNEIVRVLRKIKVSELDDLANEVFAKTSGW